MENNNINQTSIEQKLFYINDTTDTLITEDVFNSYIESIKTIFKSQDKEQIDLHLSLLNIIVNNPSGFINIIIPKLKENNAPLNAENEAYYTNLANMVMGNLSEDAMITLRKLTIKDDESIKEGVGECFKEKLKLFVEENKDKYLTQKDSPEGTIISNSNIHQDDLQNQK